jgi:hypothetical protein
MKKKPKRSRKKKLGKAAEAANRTAQVALMKKKPKIPNSKPGKRVGADPVRAIGIFKLNEQGPMVQEPSALLSPEQKDG